MGYPLCKIFIFIYILGTLTGCSSRSSHKNYILSERPDSEEAKNEENTENLFENEEK